MSTCRQVVTKALRWINVVSTGRPAPTSAEAVDGLRDLQHLYIELINRGADLTDVLADEDYEAGENQRITNSADSAIDITLPLVITDRDTNAERPPSDFAVVVITGSEPLHYVYDAALADWTLIQDLTLDGAAPWSTTFDQGLAAILAVTLAEGYGAQISQTLLGMADDARLRIHARMQMSGQDHGSLFFQPDTWMT